MATHGNCDKSYYKLSKERYAEIFKKNGDLIEELVKDFGTDKYSLPKQDELITQKEE